MMKFCYLLSEDLNRERRFARGGCFHYVSEDAVIAEDDYMLVIYESKYGGFRLVRGRRVKC